MGAVTFLFNGQKYTANAGDSIAAALAMDSKARLGWRRNGEARGHFCGMGVCHDCLVTVDGQRGVRACMTPVIPDMSVQSEHECHFADQTEPSKPLPSRDIKAEIVVIGAGPAGLTAAVRAATAGADVVVLDERGEPGGQYFKPRSDGFRGEAGPDRQHRSCHIWFWLYP